MVDAQNISMNEKVLIITLLSKFKHHVRLPYYLLKYISLGRTVKKKEIRIQEGWEN